MNNQQFMSNRGSGSPGPQAGLVQWRSSSRSRASLPPTSTTPTRGLYSASPIMSSSPSRAQRRGPLFSTASQTRSCSPRPMAPPASTDATSTSFVSEASPPAEEEHDDKFITEETPRRHNLHRLHFSSWNR